MCVLTICKIFRCGHLEAVFGVERCENAINDHQRYCNRECSPPVLKGEFSSAACSVCTQHSDPIKGLTDEAFQDFFHTNFPLMQLLRKKDIDRFIDAEWYLSIQQAREWTRCFQANFLHRRFSLDEAPFRQERFEFGRHPHRNQIDMEILIIDPCDETCPCARRRESASHHSLTPPPPPSPPLSHPLRSHPVPLGVRLYAPPVPRSDIELVERWVDIARDVPGASTAGVQHVLPSMWEREMRGLSTLGLVEIMEDAGLDLDWVWDNGLYPDDDSLP
jgi:hypothetical protein